MKVLTKIIPEELKNGFTMNGNIPILDWYINGTDELLKNEWTEDYINEYLSRFTIENIYNCNEGETPYGHDVCINLLNAFQDYNVKNKNVAVVGSTSPWIEAMLLNLNNTVTTIEYNVPETSLENLKCKDYFNYFQNNKETFDVIVSFSSIEHSGLGRYGDPLDPDGDITTMNDIYNNLCNDGLVIWGAPVGKDALVWNAHRIYGHLRMPLIFDKFKELKWYGNSKQELFSQGLCDNSYQPVIVLQK
jgi:hypothetical protein